MNFELNNRNLYSCVLLIVKLNFPQQKHLSYFIKIHVKTHQNKRLKSGFSRSGDIAIMYFLVILTNYIIV